jgi:hypothetical protein
MSLLGLFKTKIQPKSLYKGVEPAFTLSKSFHRVELRGEHIFFSIYQFCLVPLLVWVTVSFAIPLLESVNGLPQRFPAQLVIV